VCKREGGKKEWLLIGRYRCEKCNCLHTALPDCLVKYKHYRSSIIEGVIDETVSEDDLAYEDYPCATTMLRWLDWFIRNIAAIEGQIRSAAMRFLDFTDEFLKSTESLLEELRKRISRGWLRRVEKIIYNSGGGLVV